MNTQQKQKILTKFLTQLTTFQSSLTQSSKSPIPSHFSNFIPPDIDIVSQLLTHQQKINKTITNTHKNVKNVLQQLSQLQTRKQNVNKLLDCMTAIKQIKKLSFGLGNTINQIYKNIQIYYQIKNKVYYCQRFVQKIQQQIKSIKQKYQIQLQQQLKKTNSQNIVQIAKTLNLITKQDNKINDKQKQKNNTNNNNNTNNTNDTIIKFYIDLLKKQLKTYQQDLFKIPINSTNTTNSYIFFDIAKDVMKLIVNTITNYKGNIIKIGGQQTYIQVIIQILSIVMNGIILQIFLRQKKYFDIDTSDSKKLCKQANKFKDYLNQFCAIWNQIQRLKLYLINQIPLFSTLHRGFQNNLNNCINTKQLININTQIYQGIKIYTRYQFNLLLKNSMFVNSIWQLDYQFINKISESFNKGQKQQYQSNQAQDFLVETFAIIMKSLQKVFQSLNMLIISPFITFANNHLIQQDSFHAFNQLFNRVLGKMSLGQPKYYTAIVILLNTTLLLPHAFKTQLSNFKIPVQLQINKVRLQSQLKQLNQVSQYKSKQLIYSFTQSIVSSTWFTTQLKQDYKKTIEKWKGFAHQINQIFLTKASQLHSSLIIADQFNLKSPKKIITQQGIISLEKQVRTIITFYQVKGCSALNSFRRVLQYIQIMLAQNQESANKLIKKFGIYDGEQQQKIMLLRAMKVD